jgi:hypothetical protein
LVIIPQLADGPNKDRSGVFVKTHKNSAISVEPCETGNTEGSCPIDNPVETKGILNPWAWRKFKNMYKLNPIERDIIIGSLFGDASLEKNGCDYNFIVAHSPKQKDYLLWKKENIGFTNNLEERIFKDRFTKQGVFFSAQTLYRFRTKPHPDLTYLRKIFYPHGRKVIRRKALNFLTALGLAVWFMDDGYANYYKSRRGYLGCLCLCANSESECKLVQKYFKVVWDIGASIQYARRGDKKYAMLQFSSTGVQKLFSIISPYIPDCMRYKIPKRLQDEVMPYNAELLQIKRDEDIVQ